jgi:OOP family OmpA-OmpF porin
VSRFRANIVKAYLFGKGIAAERTEIEAFGSLKPVADNETRAGREKNRRVEVEVLGG